MAVDMFLEFDEADKIQGETKDSVKKEKKAIDVLAWSWGVSQSGTFHSGGGGGSGKANVQDISLTKYVDKSSPFLQLACLKGTHLTKAILTVRKAGGTEPVEYIVITLEKLLVSSCSTGGSGGEDRLTENVTLNFAKVTFEYKEQDETGKAMTPAINYGYDVEAMEATDAA